MDRTEAIKCFLEKQRCKINIYNPDMEVQVNVLPGKEFKDKKWSDDEYTWEPFRIPYKNKKYDYTLQEWPLEKYAEGIGLTGWNWRRNRSHWVGFDFDSIFNHAKGLSDDDLDRIKDQVKNIPWVTLRRSKSGKGLHLYVFFASPPETTSRAEHAALAKAILSQLSALVKFNFEDKVDTVGAVLWIWHKDASLEKGSFDLLKAGEPLEQIPPNWRDYINKKRSFSKEMVDLLAITRSAELDDDHRKLLTWFNQQQTTWWWDAELKMLVCHTADLSRAHKELNFKGVFFTNSTGKDIPRDQNCFAFPIRNGAWTVRRHGIQTKEHKYWTLDPSGWRRCYLNKLPDLDTVCRIENGVKTATGKYSFNDFDSANTALEYLGIYINAPAHFMDRRAELAPGKNDGEIIVRVKREESDSDIENWASVRGPAWERVVETVVEVVEVEPPDNIIRYCVAGESEYGWYLHTKNTWTACKKDNLKDVLETTGVPKNLLNKVLGKAIQNYWDIVNLPFQSEYPGERQWNKEAPQLAFKPKPGSCVHWDMIYQHLGKNLRVIHDDWCREYNILSGADYLYLWAASLFQHPLEPLPYLFLYSEPQNTGKSILHESLSILLRNEVGYSRADNALVNQQGFNKELANCVLAVVEEVNLSKNERAKDRLKDYVTGRTIAIRPLFVDSYTQKNTTHWIQCANNAAWCPIFPGDTRITVIPVDTLEKDIPKPVFLEKLREEAPAFLHKILSLEIPPSNGRLRIPAIYTDIKGALEEINESPLERFLHTHCEYFPGSIIKLSDFVDILHTTLDAEEKLRYGPRQVGKELPPMQYPRGRWGTDGHIHVGNIKVRGTELCTLVGTKLYRDQKGVLRYEC